jgi:ribosomal protein S18 acetylase RimI-like enzyme
VEIRNVKASDYDAIIPVMNHWWGGRQMSDMLPKLFFIHFNETSFIAEKNGEIIGFLIGFKSQTYPTEAYIHFVGVHPEYRQDGVGQMLYTMFMDTVQIQGCDTVRCVTSPVNKASIQFHTRLGFEIDGGDYKVNGVPISKDYDGVGEDRVLFMKKLN